MIDNINKFESIGFRTTIQRLPEVEFFARSVNIPSVSATTINRPSQIKGMPEHGDSIIYAPLELTFYVDDQMKNYQSIFEWIKAYTTPDKLTDYLSNSLTQGTGDLRSDISISTLTSKNNQLKTFTFTNCFPSDLSSINIEANGNEAPVLLCNATFQFDSFNLE